MYLTQIPKNLYCEEILTRMGNQSDSDHVNIDFSTCYSIYALFGCFLIESHLLAYTQSYVTGKMG